MRYGFLLLFLWGLMGCSPSSQERVTIYVSEDQVFSEPLLRAFEAQTGIKVNAIYDTEESKSTGVMNRLIAERHNPQADLYWANEPIRAEVLRQKGILAPYQSPNARGIPEKFKDPNHYWTGFSARVRVLIASSDLSHNPDSIRDYLNPQYRAKAVIANPLFGTTTVHIAALSLIWGEAETKAFLSQLKANEIAISTSNGESADLVASNRYAFALVDSDDAISRLHQGKAIRIIYPDQKAGEVGALVLPNAVMLIKNAPHPRAAKALMDYLLRPESERQLAFADCAQIPLHQGVAMPQALKPIRTIKTMEVDYANVAQAMIAIQSYLKAWL